MRLIVPALVLLCLTSCKFQVNTNASSSVEARDITYELPFQRSSSSSGSGDTFSFKGESLSFTETNGKLTVNGKEYGEVKAGDKVQIDKAGAVSVNGVPRDAQ